MNTMTATNYKIVIKESDKEWERSKFFYRRFMTKKGLCNFCIAMTKHHKSNVRYYLGKEFAEFTP